MPGSKLKRAVWEWLDEQGGKEYLLDRIASGETYTKIGREIPDEVVLPNRSRPSKQKGVSRNIINRYVMRGCERREELTPGGGTHQPTVDEFLEAEKLGASGMAEESIEIVRDGLNERDSAKVTARFNAAKSMQWYASKRDPEKFADQSKVNVNLNFAEHIHLPAMRDLGRPLPPPPQQLEEPDADYEIVDAET